LSEDILRPFAESSQTFCWASIDNARDHDVGMALAAGRLDALHSSELVVRSGDRIEAIALRIIDANEGVGW
jgi:hypothetical protein